ncbi:MAG: endonuclease [Spirochaetia bacterium]|nr:endonuclease [Spirochaetia bacterium]
MKNKNKIFVNIIITSVIILGALFLKLNEVNCENIKDIRNHKFTKFSDAKKAVFNVASQISRQNSSEKITFYCSCPFDKNKIVDIQKCGYHIRKDKNRATHVEIEHVVPADKLCGKTLEWTQGSNACVNHKGKHFKGRRCASEHNPVCIMAYNDLHNLRPAIGEINNDRSDYPFGDIHMDSTAYGTCSFKIKNGVVDPPKEVHGDIARIYLHMNMAYPELHILNENEIRFFKVWSNLDPVTTTECSQNKIIYSLQGNYNLVVLEQCYQAGLR